MKSETPSQEYLKNHFQYNQFTGDVVRVKTSNIIKGRRIEITINGEIKTYSKSLIIWKMVYGCDPERRIMFIDGDSGNVKICNMTTDALLGAKSRKQAMAIRKKRGRHVI